MTTCACRSHDRYRCMDLRYPRPFSDDLDELEDREGCQCECHDESEDNDDEW